jgi:lysophospholipase L1-like esterase
MPTIASGSNATITVSAGQILTVQSDGATFDYENPVGTRVGEYSCDSVFGPFTAGGSVKITSVQGAVYYELGTAQASNTPYNPSNVAITGGTINSRSVLRLFSARPLSVVVAGDSLTQGNSSSSAGMWSWGTSYAEGALMMAGPRFRLLANAGISGNTAAQLLARLDADVLAYAPDLCPLLIGTNDITSGMSDSAITSMMNTIEQIVLRLLRAGIMPVIATPPPNDGAIAEAKKIQWFYYALAQYYGLPLIDMFRALVDPADGSWATGLNVDSKHPNAAGIAVMQSAAAAVLTNLEKSACPPYLAAVSETSANGFANAVMNGAFANAAASPTPDGWTVVTTGATQTLVSAPQPYTGNTVRYDKTAASSQNALQAASITSAGAGFAVGDVLDINVRLKTSGLTPASASGFRVELNSNLGTFARLNNWVQNGDFSASWRITVQSGVTSLTPRLVVQDIGLYEVNNWTVFNVTRANAIWQPGRQI